VKEELEIEDIDIVGRFSFISNLKIPTVKGNVSLALIVYTCKIKTDSKIRIGFEHTE
jgi:hypothetical protein